MQMSFGETMFPVSRMFPFTSSLSVGDNPIPKLPTLFMVTLLTPSLIPPAYVGSVQNDI